MFQKLRKLSGDSDSSEKLEDEKIKHTPTPAWEDEDDSDVWVIFPLFSPSF